MRRRKFIGLVGSAAAAWPLALRAQQPAMPVIGFLSNSSFEQFGDNLAAFRQGLAKTGYIEGRNLAIEYRWTDGQTEPLPALAAELVGRRVAVIVTHNTPPTVAAQAATQTIPIIFYFGSDPVELGLVQSSHTRAATTRAQSRSTLRWLKNASSFCTNCFQTPKRLAFL